MAVSAISRRIPATVITGFFFSCKTTLIRNIIMQANGKRLALIVNEFGDVGLDHELIEFVEDEVVLMASGSC